MKTVITQNIDGIDIIINTGDAGGLIDPEATKKIANVEIKKSEHYKKIQQIKSQMKVYMDQAWQAKKNCKGAIKPAESKKFHDEFLFRLNQAKDLESDLKEPTDALNKKYKSLMLEHAIYFKAKPAEGVTEDIITDEECIKIREKMIEATQKNMLLSRDFKEILDVRGKIFFKKESDGWKAWQASKITDTPPSGYSENISDEDLNEISCQRESERVAGLKESVKSAEKENAISGLVARAGMMKNELEVSGDKSALKKAQDWLESETKKINVKYK